MSASFWSAGSALMASTVSELPPLPPDSRAAALLISSGPMSRRCHADALPPSLLRR